MSNESQIYKIEIRNENSESITFTPRIFGEVGKDLVAIKLLLGILVDIEGVISRDTDSLSGSRRTQPMDPNGWFDCVTGQQISIEQAATFDAKMQTALSNFQIKNQFLIISYLFKKYAVPGIINSIGENYNSNSEIDQTRYLATVLAQLEAIDVLFESELGRLGEATLAVMHGWVPHSVAGNSNYYHTEALKRSIGGSRDIVDVMPYQVIQFLHEGALGQSTEDLIQSEIASSISSVPMSASSAELTRYLNSTPEGEKWIGAAGIQNFDYGFVKYNIAQRDQESGLYKSTLVTIENYRQHLHNERVISRDSSFDRLRRVFYPDPFSTNDLFYINESIEGFYLETDFVLDSAGPLPNHTPGTIRDLEELALDKILKLSQKPNIWILPRLNKTAMKTMFGEDEIIDTTHSGVLPSDEQLRELKKYIPRFESLNEQIEGVKEELNMLPATGFGSANDYLEARKESLKDKLSSLESEFDAAVSLEEKIENFIILGTNIGIEQNSPEGSTPVDQIATHWRSIDDYGSEPPLVKFIEYKTPSLRPGQKYRAMFEVSSKKLELIFTGVSPVEEAEEPTAPQPNAEGTELCAPGEEEQTLRTLEEYRIHARKSRRNIVRQIREEFKEEPALRGSNNITRGKIGPFDLNRALNQLMGFDINGASDYEYTKGVLSRLGDVGTFGLEKLGVLNTDIDYFNSIANSANKELTKKDLKGKPQKNTLQITLEDLLQRINVVEKDLKESDGIISSEGIAFKKGSGFSAKKEATYLKQFYSQFKDLVLQSISEYYGEAIKTIMIQNPSKTTLSFQFITVQAKGPSPHMGPAFGKKIVAYGAALPKGFKVKGKLWPYVQEENFKSDVARVADGMKARGSGQMPNFLQSGYASQSQIKKRRALIKKSKSLGRPRTVNYISNIYDMSGLLTDKPGEIISFFDDGRGSCKDLGVNLDKKLASSYIANFTTGVQVEHAPGASTGFSWKKYSKDNFEDPAKDWTKTSAENWESSWNDTFDKQQALKLLGDMCTLEDIYKEFFDKLDLVSLLCDWLKCIRLPNFNLKLPNFYLPPLPNIPILGMYGAIWKFFRDNIKQILIRILCTFVRTIIDKLSIPFCEDQLKEFIAAGSKSGSPLMDQALTEALMNTGVPTTKTEEAKSFFDDVANITTGQELCHLLSGKSLDDATMTMIERLLEKNDLQDDLDSRESLMNYFDLLGTFIPEGLCEELQKSQSLNAPVDCLEVSDYLQSIRNRLQTGDTTLSDEEIDSVIQMAKEEMNKRRQDLQAFSGNNVGSLLPEAYAPGNPDAIVSDYPDFLKKRLEETVSNSFASARMDYVNAMDSYVPNLSISAPSTPRAGSDRYNDIQSLNFEAALTQLALYSQGMHSSRLFATKKTLQKIGLPEDATAEEVELIRDRGLELNYLAKALKSWIDRSQNISSARGRGLWNIIGKPGPNRPTWPEHRGAHPMSNNFLQHLEFLDKIRLTSVDGTRAGNTMYSKEAESRDEMNPFLAEDPANELINPRLQALSLLLPELEEIYNATDPGLSGQEFLYQYLFLNGLFDATTGDANVRAGRPTELWANTTIVPFDLEYSEMEFLHYLTNPNYSRVTQDSDHAADGDIVEANIYTAAHNGDIEFNPFEYLRIVIENFAKITITTGITWYYAAWESQPAVAPAPRGFATRTGNEVLDRKPGWLDDYFVNEDDNIVNPFVPKLREFRSTHLDETIRNIKYLLEEYISRTGYKPEAVGHVTYEDFLAQFRSQWSATVAEKQNLMQRYCWGRSGSRSMELLPTKGSKVWNTSAYLRHPCWRDDGCRDDNKSDAVVYDLARSDRFIDTDDADWTGNKAISYWLWNTNYGHGESNYEEGAFVDNWIQPQLTNERRGLEWNHELRSRKVLDVLIKTTELDWDPYTAAIRGISDAAGVSWYNTLLLFSVFETENVPLTTRDGHHKVFKRAKLPNRRGPDQQEEWNPYKNFVSYYRRLPVENTVHDYVQGERNFEYLRHGPQDLPTFVETGAVYDDVFNKIVEGDAYPIETYYTPYDKFYESTNDPLDKSEYALIVPAYLSSLEMTDDWLVEKYVNELYQIEAATIRAAYKRRIDNLDAWDRMLQKKRALIDQRDRVLERARSIISTEQYTNADEIDAQRQWAIATINSIELRNRSRFRRDLYPLHPERVELDAQWHGPQHAALIHDHAGDAISAAMYGETPWIGNFLMNVLNNQHTIIDTTPQNAYELIRNLAGSDSGLYRVFDPAGDQEDLVPIFPISQTNSAAPEEQWLSHTYDVLSSMAVELHGGVPEFFEKEQNDPRREDRNLEVYTSQQLMARFLDLNFQTQPEKTITQICYSLSESLNHPKLVKLAKNRIKELTDTIAQGLEYRPSTVSDRHLLMLDKVLRETNILTFSESGNKIKLMIEFGTYKPQISLEEIPAEKDFDRYKITVKSDFHLRLPNDRVPGQTFQMCEFLPQSMTDRNEPSQEQLIDNTNKYFSKRESFAQMVLGSLQENLTTFNGTSMKPALYDKLYKIIRNTIFSKTTDHVTNSKLFNIEYARQIDNRLSAEPTYREEAECVKNRYGLVESAVLSYNKVILEESYLEVMKEMAKPENSPFNRDYDDPHPLELSLQSISLKSFVRICLIDTLLKGGLAYSVWDIEPIVSEQLFKEYAFEHVFRELQASSFFEPRWKKIIERTVGITNPIAALKNLLEKEMVKLPDYSKQVFNFSKEDKSIDYYNWHLISDHGILGYVSDLGGQDYYNSSAGWKEFYEPEHPLHVFATDLESQEGPDVKFIRTLADPKESKNGLRIENYIKISGPIATQASELWTYHTRYTGTLGPDDPGMIDDHANTNIWEFLSAQAVNIFGALPRHNGKVMPRALALAYLNRNGRHLGSALRSFGDFESDHYAIRDGESLVISTGDFDNWLLFLSFVLERREFENIIENSTIYHGSRLIITTNNQELINQAKMDPEVRRKSFQTKSLLSVLSTIEDVPQPNPVMPEEILRIPVAKFENELKLEDCGYPSGDLFSDSRLSAYSYEEEVAGWHAEDGTLLENSSRPIHVDYVNKGLLDSRKFKNYTEHIFPLRRFLTINSIFATSMISGYNGMPTLFDSVKTSIAFIAQIASTPSSQQADLLQISPEQFLSTIQKNWPTHPQAADCFDFPLPGKEFFKKFIEDLWKLIKQLPSILFRGVANQLDPAYKEMRQHYLNCDIKNLDWDGIRVLSATSSKHQGLVNGLHYKEDSLPIEENQGKGKASYVPLLPSLILDYEISLAHLLIADPEPLGLTVARTITYAFNGMAPFLDLSMAFQIPCAGVNEDWLKDKKYDIGFAGRYGHPLTPFTILALSTPQLESDKKLKRPNCLEGRENLARYDECDE